MILIMIAQVLFFGIFSKKDPHLNAVEKQHKVQSSIFPNNSKLIELQFVKLTLSQLNRLKLFYYINYVHYRTGSPQYLYSMHFLGCMKIGTLGNMISRVQILS